MTNRGSTSRPAPADRAASIEMSEGRTVARSVIVSAATTTQEAITAAGQTQTQNVLRIFISLCVSRMQTAVAKRYSGGNSGGKIRSGHARRMSRR